METILSSILNIYFILLSPGACIASYMVATHVYISQLFIKMSDRKRLYVDRKGDSIKNLQLSFKKNLPLNRYEMEQEIANTNASARKLNAEDLTFSIHLLNYIGAILFQNLSPSFRQLENSVLPESLKTLT